MEPRDLCLNHPSAGKTICLLLGPLSMVPGTPTETAGARTPSVALRLNPVWLIMLASVPRGLAYAWRAIGAWSRLGK